MSDDTSIRVRKTTRNALFEHKRDGETYNDILWRLMADNDETDVQRGDCEV